MKENAARHPLLNQSCFEAPYLGFNRQGSNYDSNDPSAATDQSWNRINTLIYQNAVNQLTLTQKLDELIDAYKLLVNHLPDDEHVKDDYVANFDDLRDQMFFLERELSNGSNANASKRRLDDFTQRLEHFYIDLQDLDEENRFDFLRRFTSQIAQCVPGNLTVIDKIRRELNMPETLTGYLGAIVRYGLVSHKAYQYCQEGYVSEGLQIHVEATLADVAHRAGFGTPLSTAANEQLLYAPCLNITRQVQEQFIKALRREYNPRIVVEALQQYLASSFPTQPFSYNLERINDIKANIDAYQPYLYTPLWNKLTQANQQALGDNPSIEKLWYTLLVQCTSDDGLQVHLPRLDKIIQDKVYEIVVDQGLMSAYAALTVAVQHGNQQVCQRILQRWPDEAKQYVRQQPTPIYYAIERGDESLVRYIGDHLPPVFIKVDGQQMGLIETACYFGYVNILNYLVQRYHFDINYVNDSKQSVMELAARYGHVDLVDAIQKGDILPEHRAISSWHLFKCAINGDSWVAASGLLKQVSEQELKSLPHQSLIRFDTFCSFVNGCLNKTQDLGPPELQQPIQVLFDQYERLFSYADQCGYFAAQPIYKLLQTSLSQSGQLTERIQSLVKNNAFNITIHNGQSLAKYIFSENDIGVQKWLIQYLAQTYSEQAFNDLLRQAIQDQKNALLKAFLELNSANACYRINGQTLIELAIKHKKIDQAGHIASKLAKAYHSDASEQAFQHLHQTLTTYLGHPRSSAVDKLLMQVLQIDSQLYCDLIIRPVNGISLASSLVQNNGSLSISQLFEPLSVMISFSSQANDYYNRPFVDIMSGLQSHFLDVIAVSLSADQTFVNAMSNIMEQIRQILPSLDTDSFVYHSLYNQLRPYSQTFLSMLTSDFKHEGAMTEWQIKGLLNLLKIESDINQTSSWLDCAINSCDGESLVNYLTRTQSDYRPLLDELSKRNIPIESTDPVLITAINNQVSSQYVQWLIQQHAPVNIKDVNGETPLFHAIKLASQDSSLSHHYTKRLLENNAPLKLDLYAVDRHNETVLHMMIRYQPFEINDDIIDQLKGLINQPNDQGETPLHLAVQFNKPKTLEHLVHLGADLTAKTSQGFSARSLLSSTVYTNHCYSEAMIKSRLSSLLDKGERYVMPQLSSEAASYGGCRSGKRERDEDNELINSSDKQYPKAIKGSVLNPHILFNGCSGRGDSIITGESRFQLSNEQASSASNNTPVP